EGAFAGFVEAAYRREPCGTFGVGEAVVDGGPAALCVGGGDQAARCVQHEVAFGGGSDGGTGDFDFVFAEMDRRFGIAADGTVEFHLATADELRGLRAGTEAEF